MLRPQIFQSQQRPHPLQKPRQFDSQEIYFKSSSLERGVFPTLRNPNQNHVYVFPEEKPGATNGGISLFCFAWTPRRKFDEQLLSEVRIQLQSCRDEKFR